MTVAHTVDDYAALIVAAAREPAGVQTQRAHDVPFRTRVLQADAPWVPVRMGTDNRDVATKIDHSATDTHGSTEGCRTIRGILLDDAAEIELHSRHRKVEDGRIPSNFVPANLRKKVLDDAGIGEAPAARNSMPAAAHPT